MPDIYTTFSRPLHPLVKDAHCKQSHLPWASTAHTPNKCSGNLNNSIIHNFCPSNTNHCWIGRSIMECEVCLTLLLIRKAVGFDYLTLWSKVQCPIHYATCSRKQTFFCLKRSLLIVWHHVLFGKDKKLFSYLNSFLLNIFPVTVTSHAK